MIGESTVETKAAWQISQNTLRYGLYTAIATIILALTGIFGTFEGRYVIADLLTLNTVLLMVVVGGVGYLTALQARQHATAAIVNGIVGSLIICATLALMTLLEASLDKQAVSFVFPNFTGSINGTMTFGQELVPGLITLFGLGLVLGALAGLLTLNPEKPSNIMAFAIQLRGILFASMGLMVIIGLLEAQINDIIALPDALTLVLTVAITYIASRLLAWKTPVERLGYGFLIGAAIGIVLTVLVGNIGLEEGSFLRGAGDDPRILGVAQTAALAFVIIYGIIGAVGAVIVRTSQGTHNGMLYFLASLLIIGILNWQGAMNLLAAIIILPLMVIVRWFAPHISREAITQFDQMSRPEQRTVNRFMSVVMLAILLLIPIFASQYITSVLDLVLLYIIMGIGLNIMVGFAGLLDLGYVATFAIGAYSVGLLTTPSLVTCGGVHPNDIPVKEIEQVCTGVLTFWQAWPLCVLASGMAGVMLGIPVLRMRGDYLAIVTLGFGEIIRVVALSNTFKPLLGAAPGISQIPSPNIYLDMTSLGMEAPIDIGIGGATGIYYLLLPSVLLAAFVVMRLVGARLGRAWRSMRADEDVSEASGIYLVGTKLLAFGISSSFAGMGGAVFGAWLHTITPNSFTLQVSINVLSLIIIGGLGSIPGVVVGSLMLIGLPEVLRELQDFRLLVFGVLLVVAMLLKPNGLIPPPIRQLSEIAAERKAKEGGYSE